MSARAVWPVVWLALWAPASGCQWKGGPGAAAIIPQGVWRPEPARMRVYPSSRFGLEGGRAVLEARIELLDEMGDSIKGAGQLHFELLAAGGAGAPDGQRLYAWHVPLLTLAQQRRSYDPITRAYVFRLLLDEPTPPPTDTLLRVTFAPPGQRRLEAEMRLAAVP